MIRNSKEIDEGIGGSKYLDGTGKYKNFKGIKYKYAVKLFEVNSLINKKCMIYNE